MKKSDDLQRLLHTINRKSYPAYKNTQGSYQFDNYILNIDHVQGDPFASPSKISVFISGNKAGFPARCYDTRYKQAALTDYLLRLFSREIDKYNFKAKGSGKSGLISVSRCHQEVLERTACTIDSCKGDITLRMEVGFPANGRTINSTELIKILFDFLPKCILNTLYYKALDTSRVTQVIQLAEDQNAIRQQLLTRNLVAFVANGSILPRESGVSPYPMKNAIAFQSPASMEVTLQLPHKGILKGMGIPKGITLIVGGGYHGKSTLLKALELGVYNHISGDGREYVITNASAMKIRAEDGRSIKNTDISMFINNLPNGKDTVSFSTEDASGSTSQAANVAEAMEAGSSAFLIDEDTCATNFMIRDELMQQVIHPDQEPITPFIQRVRGLCDKAGISCIMVAGSFGAYFHVADVILQMNRYIPMDITGMAKKVSADFSSLQQSEPLPPLPSYNRCPKTGREFKGNNRIKLKTMGKDAFSINGKTVDLRYLEQLTDSEQTAALSYLLKYAQVHLFDGRHSLQEIVTQLTTLIDSQGLEALAESSYLPCGLALPRPQEIFAAFNRYRGLIM